MSRHGNRSKTHILIPAGTVNPNESAILEVSLDGSRKNTLVAQRGHSQNRTRHVNTTTMNYTDFESGLRNDTNRTTPRNLPTRAPASFMNSTMQSPRNEPETPRSTLMPNTLPNYTPPTINFNAPNTTLPSDPLEQTEQEERQALLSQLQEYQRARRQYLVSATPAAASTRTFNPTSIAPQTPRSIACQACCAYRTQATQTKDQYPCTETRSGPNLKTQGISLNFPPFPNQAWNFPGCSGAPSTSNACRVKPCYSDSENGSTEYCQLCEKVYNALTEEDNKDTVELYNRNKCPSQQGPSSVPSAFNTKCPCIMSQRELEKVARRFQEIRAKLGICKSLINNKVSNNDDIENISPTRSCYEPVERRMRSFEPTLDANRTEDDDVFARMIQESEKLFKQQKELLQQTRQQLINDFNRYQERSFESYSGHSLQSTPAASKSILKSCSDDRPGPSCETKRCVTVSPEVRTFSYEEEWEEIRTSPPETRQWGFHQENFEIQANEKYSPQETRHCPAETRRQEKHEHYSPDTIKTYSPEPRTLPSPELPRTTPTITPGNQFIEPCNRPDCPHGKKTRDIRFDPEKQFAYDLGKASSRVGTLGYDDLYQTHDGLDEYEAPTKGHVCSAKKQERFMGVRFDEKDGRNEMCGINGTKCPHKDKKIS